MLPALLLFAPRTIRLLPLLGRPRADVERVLGTGRRVVDQGDPGHGVSVVDGMRQEVVRHGEFTAIYVANRAQTLERDFGKAPGLSWQAALAACGIPSKGVAASPDGGTLSLSGGSLPDHYFVTYTGGAATIPERTLVIRAPFSVVFAPPPAERKAILDAIRPLFEAAFHGQKVQFVVDSIASKDGWAFVEAKPQSPTGRPLDLRRSDFADRAAAGLLGGPSCALLRQVGGRWQKVELAYFPTDVAWEPWAKAHDAPGALFPNYAPK